MNRCGVRASSVCHLVVIGAACMINIGARGQPSNRGTRVTQDAEDRVTAGWKVKENTQAIEIVRRRLGVRDERDWGMKANLVVLEKDHTPYLSNKIINRPVWQVTVDGWRVSYRSLPDVEDRFVRTLDVFVDPVNARFLKLETRWPKGERPIAPQPSAESATEQMRRHGNEVYHGFPKDPPKFSFFDVLDSVPRCGGNATEARQIIAHYIMWSRVGEWSDPRPVWAIMLRGVQQIPGQMHSNEPRFHWKVIVDAETGKCLGGSNTPLPDKPDPGRE